ALCGIVGFKPSRQRIPTDGAFPLSYSLDSIGSLARSVAACAKADAVMAGEADVTLEPAPLSGLRIGVAQGMPLENLDDTVAKRFPEGLDLLEKAGAHLSNETLPLIDDMMRGLARASILVAEAYSIHRDRLARRGADIDPIVRARLEKGRDISSADYVDAVRARAGLIRAMDERLADLDVLVMPATAIVAPRFDEVADPKAFMARNALILRNTTIGNFFDLCGISLPLPRQSGLPVGLMLLARNGNDHRLFRIAAAIERQFTQ
ncbi:MAG: amidase family protein, partial [Pseudolabrys sp.]